MAVDADRVGRAAHALQDTGALALDTRKLRGSFLELPGLVLHLIEQTTDPDIMTRWLVAAALVPSLEAVRDAVRSSLPARKK